MLFNGTVRGKYSIFCRNITDFILTLKYWICYPVTNGRNYTLYQFGLKIIYQLKNELGAYGFSKLFQGVHYKKLKTAAKTVLSYLVLYFKSQA